MRIVFDEAARYMIYAYLAVIRLDDLGSSVFTKFILAQVGYSGGGGGGLWVFEMLGFCVVFVCLYQHSVFRRTLKK